MRHCTSATHHAVYAAIFLICLPPTFVHAQERWPVTAEIYLGATHGRTNNEAGYRGNQDGLLLEILGGARLHAPGRGGPFLAIHGAVHATHLAVESDCLMKPDGGCVPWYPAFGVLSILGGWESESTNFRSLAGLALVASEVTEDGTAGLVGRIDAALPLFWHVSIAASLNGLVVPSHNHDRFIHYGVGLGLRFR